MRYRGGGVGHTYMRAIEQWLWRTGWGCEIPDIDVSEPQSGDGDNDEDKVFEDEEMVGEDEEMAEALEDEEMVEGPDNELVEGFEDEETVEGEFGYSIF